ncbi:hypothetical protein [Pseudomonas arsenicoxydans]|uniref:DUF35 domain-containing protein n=1 Tax=Pseudomonas arsenicoxydans TaxID=702115 RepID=A0A4P6G3C5_9PSED|nr:hypothetical protein [Pseudomonas arsenicoxydans]QAY85963.1 hypothetical protein CUN61_19125 [Pseudomonas arsenicoxydans]
MATTKATGTIKCFELFPPPSGENFKKEGEGRTGSLAVIFTAVGDHPKAYAVVVPDDGSPQLLCNAEDYPFSSGLKEGDKVSYMVEGPSAKFGTEIRKIS